MNWASNNCNGGQLPTIDEPFKGLGLFNQTPSNMPLPSPHFQFRGRLNSINSSFVSPMRIITSPNIHDADNFFEFQLKPADKDKL